MFFLLRNPGIRLHDLCFVLRWVREIIHEVGGTIVGSDSAKFVGFDRAGTKTTLRAR
jgi:hypothetical protein